MAPIWQVRVRTAENLLQRILSARYQDSVMQVLPPLKASCFVSVSESAIREKALPCCCDVPTSDKVSSSWHQRESKGTKELESCIVLACIGCAVCSLSGGHGPWSVLAHIGVFVAA